MNSILKRRRALMAQQSGSTPILPAEYQRVEFIEAISGNPFIETNIRLDTNTPTIKVRYYKANQATAEEALISCHDGSNTKVEIGFTGTANRLFAFSSSSAQIISGIVYDHIVDVIVTLNSASPYITMSASSGGTTETGSKTGANSSNVSGSKIILFALKFGQSNVFARMYSCEFLDESVQIAYFVPCYRKSDNVVGMYETVSGAFYTSATASTFVKGADV